MAAYIKIQVLSFGIVRDITGAARLELELAPGTNVRQVQEQLRTRYPALSRLNTLLVAVNAEYASPEAVLNPNDEIALIPPVSGG